MVVLGAAPRIPVHLTLTLAVRAELQTPLVVVGQVVVGVAALPGWVGLAALRRLETLVVVEADQTLAAARTVRPTQVLLAATAATAQVEPAGARAERPATMAVTRRPTLVVVVVGPATVSRSAVQARFRLCGRRRLAGQRLVPGAVVVVEVQLAQVQLAAQAALRAAMVVVVVEVVGARHRARRVAQVLKASSYFPTSQRRPNLKQPAAPSLPRPIG